MADVNIRYQLDLLLRLLDATTGTEIQERDVRFQQKGQAVHMISKGGGIYLCINRKRENFFLQVNIYGYEEKTILINFALLDESIPLMDIYMIPKETISGIAVLTFQGMLQGISEIQAVSYGSSHVFIQEYDERKKIVSLFNPHKLELEHTDYGIIHGEQEDYENIQIEKHISSIAIKITEGLKEEFQVNSPIERVIFGSVDLDGNYLLRVRDEGSKLLYLVKYKVNGEFRCQKIDFHNLEQVQLAM